MNRVLFFITFYIIFLSGCLQPPSNYNTQATDECNFSMSPFGVGHRWNHLPVEITFHSKTYHNQAVLSTIKVIREWNETWRASGQNTDLFLLLGGVDYENSKQVEDDNLNSLTIIDTHENRNCSNGNPNKRCFLNKKQQGVTSLRGKGFSSVEEADVFINKDDYKYYFEEEANGLALASQIQNGRGLNSYHAPVSVIKKIWLFILDSFFTLTRRGDRTLAVSDRGGSVPRLMVDFESLISHELGHVLALGHNNITGSIMQEKLAQGVKRRGLRRIELDSLLCGYGE